MLSEVEFASILTVVFDDCDASDVGVRESAGSAGVLEDDVEIVVGRVLVAFLQGNVNRVTNVALSERLFRCKASDRAVMVHKIVRQTDQPTET